MQPLGKPSHSRARPMVTMKTMTIRIVLRGLGSALLTQEPPAAASARGGCGPSEAYFDVQTDRKQHPVATPDAGKAIVYVFEDIENGPTMRVGVDGAWVGANKRKSYFFFSVDPGHHQVCTNWQSGTFQETSKRICPTMTLKTEAGKVYYLRTQIYERSGS